MPKLFAINYTVYFEAYDPATAVGVGVGFAEKITHALRQGKWVEDNSTLAVAQTGTVRLATPQEYFLGVGSFRRSLRVEELAHKDFDRRQV